MKFREANLFTPIYVKTRQDLAWPEEKVFYMLSQDGLFLCRNHPFFCSCVPAPRPPQELAGQETFLELRFPKIPRHLLEEAVGFFAAVGEKYGTEAALVIIWDALEEKVRLIAPKQLCTLYEGYYGHHYAKGVRYELPTQLSEGWVIFGDIHSHVGGMAYASMTDKLDEVYRPGLHIVIGRINEEPPEFHIQAIVDGVRFDVEPEEVFEGYVQRRQKVHQKWFEQLEIEYTSYYLQHNWNKYNSGTKIAKASIPGEEDDRFSSQD